MPRKGENIYKRKDGRWEGRYIKGRTLDNKAHYGYVYGKTYKEVKVVLAEKRAKKQVINKQGLMDISFEDAVAEWKYSIQNNLKESTKVKYHNLLHSYIFPVIGNKKLSQINGDCLLELSQMLLTAGGNKKTGLSAKTVSDSLALIKNIFHYLSTKGYSVNYGYQNATVKCMHPPLRVFSVYEQERLCNYLQSHISESNLGVLVCLFTGIRIGELCALKWGDICVQEKTLHVNKTMQRIQVNDSASSRKTQIIVSAPKSDCSIRTIPIPECIWKEIENRQRADGCFFLTGNHSYVEPRTMQNRFKTILSECGIDDANFHTLRHTFATRCVEVGFDIKSLSEILGHANVNITLNRYVHPSIDTKRDNMDKLSNLFAVK